MRDAQIVCALFGDIKTLCGLSRWLITNWCRVLLTLQCVFGTLKQERVCTRSQGMIVPFIVYIMIGLCCVFFCLCFFNSFSNHRINNIAITGGQDKIIRFWDFNDLGNSHGGCVGVLNGHNERLCCLQYDPDQQLVVSGAADSTIKVWDCRMLNGASNNTDNKSNHKLGTSFEGDSEDEDDFDDDYYTDNSSKRKSDSSFRDPCLRTLRGHTGRVYCLQFDHEKIVSGSDDNKIKIWPLHGSSPVFGGASTNNTADENCCSSTLVDHDYWVNSLQFNESKLVSGAADDTIKIWDFAASCKYGGISGEGRETVEESKTSSPNNYRHTIFGGGKYQSAKGENLANNQMRGLLSVPLPAFTVERCVIS